MAINGVGSSSDMSKLLMQSYQRLSSGKRINSAADDAAGLAINKKIEAQLKGWDVGESNARDMQNLLRTADGALSGVEDGLQRTRELSVQAANGIYSDSDRAILQNEVSQMMEGVQSYSKNTEFNKKTILDGTFVNQNTADNPSGNGTKISIGSSSLDALNLTSYDVTNLVTSANPQNPAGQPQLSSIDDVDKALSAASENRAAIGAQMNRLDSTASSAAITSENLAATNSRIEDADMGKEVSNLSKANVLQQVQIATLKMQMDNQKQKLGVFGQQ